MYTTLKKIREQGPCTHGWVKLLKHLGKNSQDDEPLSFTSILDSSGLDDAIWCLHTLDDHKAIVRFALGCAQMVEHLMVDERSRNALRIVEAWLKGSASEEELKQAAYAAGAADVAALAALAAWGVRASLVARGVLAAGDAGEVCAEDAARAASAAWLVARVADAADTADVAWAAAWAAAWAGADAADAADAAHAAARSEWASVAVYAAWAAAAEARAEIVERQRQLFLDIFGKE